MRKSKELVELIAQKREAAKALLDKGADITADDIKSVETARDEITALETECKQAEAIEAFEAENAKALVDLRKPVTPAPFAKAGGEPGQRKVGLLPMTSPIYRGKPQSFKGEGAHDRAYGFGMWFLATIGNEKAKTFCADNGIEFKVHSEGVNANGGYLVPHQFENDLIDLRETYGVFRRNAKVVPMTSDTRSDPRRVGGLTAYWAGESDALTQSTKSWDRVQLTAKKLTVLARITSELNEDSVIGIADDLASEIAYAFSQAEDLAGFIGDGTSTYGHITGVSNALLGLSATRAYIAGLYVGTGNLFSELVLADFNGVKAKLPQYAKMRGAKWYCSQAFYYGVMEKLAVAAGGVTEQGIAGGGGGLRFLGDPVEITQAMPTVDASDQVAALYGNLPSAARLGDRRNTTIALSEHSRFANDEVEVRGIERLDIVVHDVGNAHATAGSRVAGPIVGLLMAAS